MNVGKIDFLKTKLNSDASLSKMLPGDSRYILNSIVHASESGNVGDIENIKGNTEQTNTALPGGTLTTVGACKDRENGAVIYFIYSTTGVDAIMRYYIVDKSFETILRDNLPAPAAWEDGLNFSPSQPIQARVIGGNLIWTDGTESIRQINIKKAINFTAGTGTPAYTEMTEQTLKLVKYPPPYAPLAVYTDDDNFEANHLRGNLFQFQYRYIYDDWGKSVYSDISDPPLPIGSEYWYGEVILDLGKNNKINLTINGGNQEVLDIEIIARKGSSGAWFLVDKLDKAELEIGDDEEYVYGFYNNKSTELESQIEAGELFSYVPQLADTLDLLEDNRLILGGITEGFEKVDIAVNLSTDTEELVYQKKGAAHRNYKAAAATLTEHGTGGVDYYWELDEDPASYNWPVAGDILEITVNGEMHDFLITAAEAGAGNHGAYIDFIKSKLVIWFGTKLAVNESPADVLEITCIRPPYAAFTLEIILYAAGAADAVLKEPGFKLGAHHPFCVIYYDITRQTNGAHVNDDCSIYVPFYTEQVALTTSQYKHEISWDIGNTPPIWATHWQWGYALNSTVASFVQYPVFTGVGTAIVVDTVRHITTIDITPLQTISDWDATTWHLGTSIEPYVFTKGDRVRFITQTPPDLGNADLGALINVYVDLEILGVGTAADVGINQLITEEIDPAARIGAGIGKVDDRSLIEIYTPKKETSEVIYYTYGGVYRIENAGTVNARHYGETQNQGATDNIESSTVGPNVQLTMTGHSFNDGDRVYVADHLVNLAANGFWTVTNKAANTIELSGATGTAIGGTTGTCRLAATGTFTKGDVYHVLRVFNVDIDTGAAGDEHPVMTESMHYSDFYDSDVYPVGRPMIELDDDIGEGIKSSLLRHGGIYIPNTQINNLANFSYDDYTTKLSVKDGTINRLDFNGEILKVFQTHKKTSIYIGKVALYKADGTANITSTDAVIGSIHPGIGDEGTVFPGSVVHNGTHTYFYDIYKGEVVRDAYNGMFSISDYDMKKYFSNKSRALLDSGVANVDVQAVFDEKYGLYIITFIDSITPANNDTVAFHEASNSWISFYSFIPEIYSSFGEAMVSFKAGKLYTHNDNSTYCNFYGTQYSQEVDIVFNAGVDNVKVFKTIAVYSNKKWDAPLSGDITTPPTNLYSTGMSSRLRAPHFLDIEGVFRAAFLQNELTTMGVALQADLITGEDLRGSAIRVNLKNSEIVSTVLHKVEMGFDLSA